MYNFKFYGSHFKKVKTVENNFKNIFYLTQIIQNITSKYNQYIHY